MGRLLLPSPAACVWVVRAFSFESVPVGPDCSREQGRPVHRASGDEGKGGREGTGSAWTYGVCVAECLAGGGATRRRKSLARAT